MATTYIAIHVPLDGVIGWWRSKVSCYGDNVALHGGGYQGKVVCIKGRLVCSKGRAVCSKTIGHFKWWPDTSMSCIVLTPPSTMPPNLTAISNLIDTLVKS